MLLWGIFGTLRVQELKVRFDSIRMVKVQPSGHHDLRAMIQGDCFRCVCQSRNHNTKLLSQLIYMTIFLLTQWCN
jgi:hypothetical protein